MLDRLSLNEERIHGMADGLRQVAALADPVGEVLSMAKRPNGLQIGQQRVPIGVIGIIYEARPNVTCDAAGLCLKAGNAVILRGGSEAFHSNQAIVSVLSQAAASAGFPEHSVQLIEDTSRETALELMKLNEYIDVLIPRGGAGLIEAVVKMQRFLLLRQEPGTATFMLMKNMTVTWQPVLSLMQKHLVQRCATQPKS